MRQRRAFAGCAAWNNEIDARLNLPLDQSSQRRFVKRTIASKRGDKCRAGACKHDAFPFFFPQLNSLRISRNSNTPCLPLIHRSACNAPRAKPSRLRAVCRSVMVSADESKPISCVPGCAPARFEARLTGWLKPCACISSASFFSVPEGVSFFAEW